MAVIRASQEAYKRILATAAIDGLSIEIGLDRLLTSHDLEVERLNSEVAKVKAELAKKPKEVVKEVVKEVMPSTLEVGLCAKCGKPLSWALDDLNEAINEHKYSHHKCLKKS
jgi:hypothetical protein